MFLFKAIIPIGLFLSSWTYAAPIAESKALMATRGNDFDFEALSHASVRREADAAPPVCSEFGEGSNACPL